MSEYTPEPWKIGDGQAPFYAWAGQITGEHQEDGREFILASMNQNYGALAIANARRIVACVNALKGASTEDLEQAVQLGINDVSMGNLFSSRIKLARERDEARAMVTTMAVVIRDLLDMANRHDCGECGGFLSSELDFVDTAEKAIAEAKALYG